MLELSEITKRFRSSGFKLAQVSFQLGTGLHILAGPNGAGKSTLLRIIATVWRADSGRITVNHQDVYADLFRYKLNLGYLPQTFGFYDQMTGRQFLLYMAGLKGMLPRQGRKRADEVSELLGLRPDWDTKLTAWSVGQRQRLGLAQALLNDSAILILDEPFAGLASQEAEQVAQLLSILSRDKLILLSTHLMDGLRVDGILLLVNGVLQYKGLASAFIDAARGRVWRVELAKDEWLKEKTRFPVGTVISEGSRCSWRIINEREPDLPGVKAVLPTLEEAYSWWLGQGSALGPGYGGLGWG